MAELISAGLSTTAHYALTFEVVRQGLYDADRDYEDVLSGPAVAKPKPGITLYGMFTKKNRIPECT